MDLKSVLLGFLRRREATGYELKGWMEHSVGFFFGASYGSIYPALRELESGGFVRVREVVQSGRPNKKVYAITPEGEAYFEARLGEPPADDSFRSEFLMHLFFGHHHSPERLLEYIERYRRSREEKLSRLREIGQRIEGLATPYGMMCLRHGLITYESTLEWLDGVEEQVRELAEKEAVHE